MINFIVLITNTVCYYLSVILINVDGSSLYFLLQSIYKKYYKIFIDFFIANPLLVSWLICCVIVLIGTSFTLTRKVDSKKARKKKI